VIGVRDYERKTEENGVWAEPAVTTPKNLYEAQVAARRKAGKQ
jgi:hypothetical protein